MEKKKKIIWQQVAATVFMMIIGGVCGFLMVGYVDSLGNGDLSSGQMVFDLVVLFAGMYAAMYLQIIVHEAGHLIFGLLSGYKFSSFRIGSFMLIKQDEKIKFRRLNIAGTGGQCLMVPPELIDGKIPVVLYNLGGSLMNIMVSLMCVLLWYVFARDSMVGAFLLMMAIIGIASAIINGVPMRMGVVDNDGYNALSLGRNPEALRAFWIQMKMNEQIVAGVRLKDMPDEWFGMPSNEGMKNSMVVSIGVFYCNRLMDALRFEEANEKMQDLLHMESGIIGLHRNLLICDVIYCELIGENRKEKIETLMDKEQKKFMKSMKDFPSVLRTRYVYTLIYEKDGVNAKKIKKQFEKRARTYPHPSEIEGERELMMLAEGVSNK